MCFSSPKAPAAPAPLPPPPPPVARSAREQPGGQPGRRTGRQRRQQTILTGPLGLTGEAPIQRKTLLGE